MECFFFKRDTAYEMRISDWSSDVCSSDLDTKTEVGVAFADIGTRRRPPAAEKIAVVVELERRGAGERVHERRICDHIIARLAVNAERARMLGSASCRARVCQYV